jgi:hypothetical protein
MSLGGIVVAAVVPPRQHLINGRQTRIGCGQIIDLLRYRGADDSWLQLDLRMFWQIDWLSRQKDAPSKSAWIVLTMSSHGNSVIQTGNFEFNSSNSISSGSSKRSFAPAGPLLRPVFSGFFCSFAC